MNDNDTYQVVDTKTGEVVYQTTYANRKRARAVCDRRDNAYGAVRFVCRVVYATEVK